MGKMTISDIKDKLDDIPIHGLEEEIRFFQADERLGVRRLMDRYRKKILDYEKRNKARSKYAYLRR